MSAAVSAMECIEYGSGVAIVIILLCSVPFFFIIHQMEQSRRKQRWEPTTALHCLFCANSESNGLWPGSYTRSVNEAGWVECIRSRSTRLELLCEQGAAGRWPGCHGRLEDVPQKA